MLAATKKTKKKVINVTNIRRSRNHIMLSSQCTEECARAAKQRNAANQRAPFVKK